MAEAEQTEPQAPEPGQFRPTLRTYESLVDQKIARAMAEGQFTNLPGEGQPQRWDDDSQVPEDLRLGYHLLKSNGFAPPWIEARRDVDEARARVAAWLAAANARWPHSDRQSRSLLRAEYHRLLAELHRTILTYNLRLPPGVEHLVNIRIEAELARLGDATVDSETGRQGDRERRR
jgi:hypothetical protein